MADAPLVDARPTARTGSAWFRGLAAYALGAALVLGVGQGVVASLVLTWAHTTTYHHGFVVLPICLYLIWRQRRRLAVLEPTGSPLGLLALLPFGLLWVLGAAADVMFLQQVGLVGLLAALVPALLGWRVARVLWFPLVFAFAMVPFGEELVPALQQVTAEFSVGLLRLFGVPVFHEGLLIQTPSGYFEVAEACAGLRFLIANLVVAFLFCHFSYRTWWKWLAFMALATVVPIVANGLRAFGIILVAYETDNAVATGVDHIVYGWGFFTVVMLISLFLGNLFADRGLAGFGTVPVDGDQPRRSGERRGLGLGFAALVILVALAGPFWSLLMARAAGAAEGQVPSLAGGAWPGAEETAAWPGTAWEAEFPGADATESGSYLVGGTPVDLFQAYYRYQRQGSELIHGANRLYGEPWIRVDTRPWSASINGVEAPGRVLRLASGEERRLVAAFYWIDGRFVGDSLEVKLRQAAARLQLREPPAGAIAVSTPVGQDLEAGLERLRRFLSRVELAGLPGAAADGS